MKTTLGAIFLSVVAVQTPPVTAAQTPWPPADVSRQGEPGVVNPSLVKQVEPSYTQEAMRAKLQGSVVLSAIVLADGTVGEVRVVKSLGLGLDESAMAAAKQWQFRPGTKNGTPVAVFVTFGVTFRLHDGSQVQPPAPVVTPAPFTWPEGFSPELDTSVPGPGWTNHDEETDTVRIHLSFPSTWTLTKGVSANQWLMLTTRLGSAYLFFGIPRPTPIPGPMVPLPQAVLDQAGPRLASMPSFAGSELRRVGQAKNGDQFWLWIDVKQPLDPSTMPPEAQAIAKLARPEIHSMIFNTSAGMQSVMAICTILVPKELSAEEADAQFRKAGAEFIAVLSRMTVVAR